jgi:Major royal jelly protein
VTSPEAYHSFELLGDRGEKSQSTAEFHDPTTDVIFYTLINRDAIGCWNVNKPYTPENQHNVDSDSNTLVFPNDLKVDNEGNIYVLSDRMPLFLYKELDKAVNYRILSGKTADLIAGTVCDK